jgi:aerobic C4-dicarboxylate transport protein
VPVGAFGAMAFTVGKYGIASLGPLAKLVGIFYLTSSFFALVVLGLVSWRPLRVAYTFGASARCWVN